MVNIRVAGNTTRIFLSSLLFLLCFCLFLWHPQHLTGVDEGIPPFVIHPFQLTHGVTQLVSDEPEAVTLLHDVGDKYISFLVFSYAVFIDLVFVDFGTFSKGTIGIEVIPFAVDLQPFPGNHVAVLVEVVGFVVAIGA